MSWRNATSGTTANPSSDSVLWTELDVTAGLNQATGRLPARIMSYPGLLLTEETALALERHARDFPLTCHTRPGGDGRPIRRSDLQSTLSFRGSAFYAEVVQKIGIDEMLAMALKPGRLHVCVSLNRTGPDFSPRRSICSPSSGRCWPAGSRAWRPARLGRPGGDLRTLAVDRAAAASAPPGRRRPDRCRDRAPPRLQPSNNGQAPGTHLSQPGVSCRTAAIAAAYSTLMDTAAAADLQGQDAAVQAGRPRVP